MVYSLATAQYKKRIRILMIENPSAHQDYVAESLRLRDFSVLVCHDVVKAAYFLKMGVRIDAIIVESDLLKQNNFTLLKAIRDTGSKILLFLAPSAEDLTENHLDNIHQRILTTISIRTK